MFGHRPGVHAPDQLLGQCPRLSPAFAVLTFAQVHPLEVTIPGLIEQRAHRLRDVAVIGQVRNNPTRHLGRLLLSRPALFGITKALLHQLAPAAVQIHEVAEVLEQLVKQLDIVGELMEHPLHHRLDLVFQRIALSGLFFGPANGRQRELIQQLTNRVATAIEKVLVAQGNLEHRDLQPTDQRLHDRV